MYDPTIFENLKVAVENYVYDLDNLASEITITNRVDNMEMATMSRSFQLQFVLADEPGVEAEVVLEASLKDLAAELLEVEGENPGCTLLVRFYMQIDDVEVECAQIEELLHSIWDQEKPPTQTISYVYGQGSNVLMNKIEVTFNQRINEDQMEDIPSLIDHVIESLQHLNDL
ncbi:hypothetical protein [Pseudalkalibacillus sp. SCS-8]|uniref:hypothetical protein n=1 Tax=Pseudalkalibacillus nanhaiensis TaxID=3115291 RepID=UPI0032DAE628